MSNTKSLQEQFAPSSICFGCGPANAKGLRIRSFAGTDAYTCDFTPAPEHQAFPGMVNGGIIGSILDCHSNWAAAHHLMKATGSAEPPCTVTAEYAIKLFRPTPLDSTLHLEAKIVETADDRVRVEATLTANGKVC